MAYNFPGNQSAGGGQRSAPYHRVFTSFAAATDLTAQVTQAPNATSGLFVNVTAAGNLVWKDCSGNTNTLPLPIGVFDLWWCAATSLEISTITGAVCATWHGTARA